MRVFNSSKEITETIKKAGVECVGFVPTMGALHEGHLSLVARAVRDCDLVVVSIFVNPTQFNDPKDLKSYPRMLDEDLALLERAGADIVFTPTVEEIYPEPDKRVFDFGNIDKVMEGATRPGHFNGVAQVVSRLFDIVLAHKAFFGEKDFQQIALIRAMVKQLGYTTEIVPCPIVRDTDGLALSSRNLLLDKEHRAAAPLIYKTLKEAVAMKATASPQEVKRYVIDTIDSDPLLRVIYFSIVDAETLEEATDWVSGRVQGCVAVQAGSVRLIDNIRFE